jgi:ubiquitin-protein ligase
MIWWAKDPDRLRREVSEIELLRDGNAWLAMAAPRFLKELRFAFDFDVTLNGDIFPFTLEYPAFFPDAPPLVVPRDGRRLSDHQYGSGGELCLEFRSDNWDPSVTGAMLIESTYRLLSGERPGNDGRAIVPSAHTVSLGQELRGSYWRFLLTRGFVEYAALLPIGQYRDAMVNDIMVPKDTWVAYVGLVGSSDAPDWREGSIPDRAEKGAPGVLLRVASLADLPANPDQAALDQLISAARGDDLVSAGSGPACRFTVITDAHSARMFYSYPKDGGWNVIAYRTVDLTDDIDVRLPQNYSLLAGKRVGIVGCGSLGSKVAASLARSGVHDFVLVDDDILKPGNLVRHDLDAGSLGAHKADGLAARLKAIAVGVKVRVRRVALGGQESSGTTASALDELAGCDLLIDATADPQAFNFVASVARSALRPMVWAEVYAGGIGGCVARLRPGFEPPPHAARHQYLAWCRQQRVAWHGRDRDYGTLMDADAPLIADDGDVTVIAAHASRMAIDVLVRPGDSIFPYPAYVIGLSGKWIFDEPFDTRPITFSAAGDWQAEVSSERTTEAIEFMLSLFEPGDHADRTGT